MAILRESHKTDEIMSSKGSDQEIPSIVGSIADFVHTQVFEGLPDAIKLIAREHFLDTIGCCLSATKLDTSRSLAHYLLSEGGVGQATAIGVPGRLPAPQAAFMNGLLARSLEFDDIAMPDIHPSGAIVPVVLALCETQSATGQNAIAATALGLELCLRIGRAGIDRKTRTSGFLQRGQDATAICGALAGAAVAAKLLGLDPKGIANAVGIAVSFAGGSLEANRSGGTIKRFQSGWAAKSAIQAAMLAKFGVDGPLQAIEGRYGFYQCFVGGQFDRETLTEGLGSSWQISSLRFKPYPSNYYTHAGIDAALALRKNGLMAQDIDAANLAVATPMLHTVGEPLDRKRAPQTAYEAKFSAPYTVASALIGGTSLGVGIDDFSEKLLRDPVRQALMHKVSVTSDARCDSIFPDQAPAILTVYTKNESKLIQEVLINRGSAECPLSDEDLARKFSDNVTGVLAPDIAASLRLALNRIEEEASVDGIVRILATVADN
jgi:2-methylcitrate dehydratase PrpD